MPHELNSTFASFCTSRQPPKTFCPSEVARALSADELARLGCEDWRAAMPAIRELAWQERAAGRCEVLQKGMVLGADVRLEDVHGPIRVRRADDGKDRKSNDGEGSAT